MDAVNYRTTAKKRWPDAEWISGDGPYASLAHCNVLTVQLHTTRTGAERAISFIDRIGCGGACSRDHDLVVLETEIGPSQGPGS